MNKSISVVLLSLACGVSPMDAAEELSVSSSWCGWNPSPPSENVEKFSNHPNGYGITSTLGCFDSGATWPGGYCFAPSSTWQWVRIYKDGQTDAWFKNATDEYGVLEARLNEADWDVSRVSGLPGQRSPTIEVHTGTTDPTGYLGTAQYGGWVLADTTDQGEYWTVTNCTATLFKTSIEANQFYQAASSARKLLYLKNLWQHEMLHCLGQAHVTVANTLMSVSYTYPGTWFTSNLNHTDEQQQMFVDFDPLN